MKRGNIYYPTEIKIHLEFGVAHDPAEGFHGYGASSNVLMPVSMAVEGSLGIIDMHALGRRITL